MTRTKMACHLYKTLLLQRLKEVIAETGCECIALSGGIDTSLLTAAASSIGLVLKGYLVIYSEGIPRDLNYAEHVARKLGLKLKHIIINDDYIAEKTRLISGYVESNDCIELRNDIIFYAALEEARKDGCKCMYVGSGGDEVFVGYNYMVYSLTKTLEELTVKYAVKGRYPELILGRKLGMKVVAPYLSEKILDLALKIPIDCLRDVRMRGKEILREMLQDFSLSLISNRVKTPAEAGAGTERLCINV